MKWPIFISGLAAVFCPLGHFSVGSKQYLNPMLAASFDEVARKVNHCVFHYVSVDHIRVYRGFCVDWSGLKGGPAAGYFEKGKFLVK